MTSHEEWHMHKRTQTRKTLQSSIELENEPASSLPPTGMNSQPSLELEATLASRASSRTRARWLKALGRKGKFYYPIQQKVCGVTHTGSKTTARQVLSSPRWNQQQMGSKVLCEWEKCKGRIRTVCISTSPTAPTRGCWYCHYQHLLVSSQTVGAEATCLLCLESHFRIAFSYGSLHDVTNCIAQILEAGVQLPQWRVTLRLYVKWSVQVRGETVAHTTFSPSAWWT